MKIDQETLVFTVLGGALVYMFLTNLPGQHIDEEAERQRVVSEMELRAEAIKQDALDLHSKVGELDNVESKRRGIVARYLALERENESAAQKYTGYSQFQKRSRALSAQIQELVKKVVPQDLYHHDEEMLSPIPEGSAEGSRGYSPTEGTFYTASRKAVSDVTSLPVFTQNLTAANLQQHNLERQYTLSRASEDLRSVVMSASPSPPGFIHSPSPVRPSVLHRDIPADLAENNRHNLVVGGQDGSRSGSAFVQLKSLHPSVKAANDRANSRAGTNDATIELVNTESEVGLLHNESRPSRPVAKVSEHVDQHNFANKDFGPKHPRHPVGETVVRTFESDETKAAHEGNAIDNQQPASASPFMQGEIPVASERQEGG